MPRRQLERFSATGTSGVAIEQENISVSVDLDFLRGIIDAVPNPIFIKDDQHRFVALNQAMCELLGHPHHELIGRRDEDFVPKALAEVYLERDRVVLETGQVDENEELITDGEGALRTIITRKKRLELANGARLVVGCISDITEFRRAEDQIRYNAEHDHLTGLANRSLFRDRLADAVNSEGANRLHTAILFIDLDGFKAINDTLGHAAGDNILVQTAAILESLTGPDDIVARLGGDEFAIIQHCEDQPVSAGKLASAVIERLSKPTFLGTRQAQVSASIGIAAMTVGSERGETLMRRADLALYCAKKEGRNTWRLFEAEMEARHLVSRYLEEDLRRAVTENQISVAYQPLALPENLEVVGFEALMRWRHPRRGMISPKLFIPMAEETGLIGSLGAWMLHEACAEAVRWSKPLRISINVSPIQFVQADLPELVQSVVIATGIDARRIDLEITETAVVRDLPGAQRMFDALRELGVRIVLDDFGAGYSSLRILKSLPFDKVKIDKSLLHDVGHAPRADAIIGAILRLARTLNLSVCVEGVETEDQLALLRREHCDELQGYLIGRPEPIASYAHIIASEATLQRA
jgi:diguanylate cyclase (GGDEF)-like protein/PAS domain S-box-containing protein